MKAILVGLILSWALNLLLAGGGEVHASLPWQIVMNESSIFGASQWCSTYKVSYRVMGSSDPQEICIYEGEIFQLGLTAENRYQLVARHFLDESFRPVRIDCSGGCFYNPEADLLIVRRPGFVLNIFTRISQKLTVGGSGSYDLDVANPDYQLIDAIGSFALSENGEWLVVEIKNKGIDRIDLRSHEKIRVIEPGIQYGFGHDPIEELAISNDGKYVVQMGEEAGFLLVEVSDSCSSRCPAVSMSVSDITPRFYFAGHPKFDYGSGRLSFYFATHGQGSRRVIIQKPDYQVTKLAYLALGDSFTSGEGEVDDRFYRFGIADLFSRCHQSIRAYPMLLATSMELPTTNIRSVACAGARISDIIHPMVTYIGQASGLSNVSEFERRRLQSEALEAFLPGRAPQGPFVGRYQPTIVTIGIGGNDAGFMSKLKACAMPDICEWAEDPAYRYATAVEIQRLFYPLKEVYIRLQNESFSSRIYAIGYPEIIYPDGVCGPITSILLSYSERLFMQQGIRYLNQVIKAAAEASGVTFVDVEQAFNAHRLCEMGTPAVNGLRLGDDVAVFSILKVIGNESFHPTPYGHKLLSEAIPDLRIAGVVNRPVVADPPPFPLYWEESAPQAFTTFYEESISADHVSSGSSGLTVGVLQKTFVPNSWVNVEIHSEKEIEQEVKVSNDGGFQTNITINHRLATGFHTLHIFGESYSGGLVDVYKIISYGDLEEKSSNKPRESILVELPSGADVLGTNAIHTKKVETLSHLARDEKPESRNLPSIPIVILMSSVLGIIFLARRAIKSAKDRGG